MQLNGIRADLIKNGVVRERKEKTPKEKQNQSFLQNMLTAGDKAAMESAGTASFKESREIDCVTMAEYHSLRVKGTSLQGTLKQAKWQGMSYEQSDVLRIDILGGYTLKAKVNEADRGNSPCVYVEAKYDDGRQEAYILELDEVKSESKNPVEAIAYEALYGKQNEKGNGD